MNEKPCPRYALAIAVLACLAEAGCSQAGPASQNGYITGDRASTEEPVHSSSLVNINPFAAHITTTGY